MCRTIPQIAPARAWTPASVAALACAQTGGYGLPCSKCRMYYPLTWTAAPSALSPERVSPTAYQRCRSPNCSAIPAKSGRTFVDDRDRLLKELKSQIFQAHTQINAAAHIPLLHGPESRRKLGTGRRLPQLLRRASSTGRPNGSRLHIDLKRGGTVVYKAVWADSSDPARLTRTLPRAVIGTAQAGRNLDCCSARISPGATENWNLHR